VRPPSFDERAQIGARKRLKHWSVSILWACQTEQERSAGWARAFFASCSALLRPDFFVLSPCGSFNVDDPANAADLLLFGPLASYCAMLIGRMRMVIEREQEKASTQQSRLRHDGANRVAGLASIGADQDPTVPPRAGADSFFQQADGLRLGLRGLWN
jgi:hypothetical protein